MRNMPFAIPFNLAWCSLYPLIARVSFVHVILPTIISLPLLPLSILHLCSYYYGGPTKCACGTSPASSCWVWR
jgi:hypothetical protein